MAGDHRSEDGGEAAPEDTEQARGGASAGAPTSDVGQGQVLSLAGGQRVFGGAADADGPGCGHRQDQPAAVGACRVGHLGGWPVPAVPLPILAAVRDPGAYGLPRHGGLGGGEVRPH
jgi:hypothetical protein